MNLLDLLILAVLAVTIYRGLINGFVSEALGIAGIVLAVFLTFRYMDQAAGYIRPFFSADAPYIPFIAGTLIFVLTLLLVHAAARFIRKFLKAVNLSVLNRLAGGLFGLAKGAILISALLLILAGYNLPSEESRERSISYSYVIQAAPMAYDAVSSLFPEIENYEETLREALEDYDPIDNLPLPNN